MGVSYEFNWYLVTTEDKIKEQENGEYVTVKDEMRIYPVGVEIPLILKNIGCIGMAKIINFEVSETETKVTFKKSKKYKNKKEILDHYYNSYLEK